MKQQGFITLPIMGWAAIAAGVVIVGLGIAVKVQTSRLDAVKAEYAQFKGGVQAIGEAAKIATAAREAADKDKKERADAENLRAKRDLAGVYSAYRSLRDQRARGSVLPEAAPGSTGAATACFDRSALDRGMADADGVLQQGAEKILLRGDAAIVDLNTAKSWAQGRP